MVKLSVLIKGIILYVIFVIGISIVMEWVSPKTQLDNQIELFLQSIKEDIKNQFLEQSKEHFESFYNKQPVRPLGMGYRPEYQNNQRIPEPPKQETEEEKIIKAVNDRLMYSNMSFDNNLYTNLNNQNNINYVPLAKNDDFSYTPVKFNWEENILTDPKQQFPRHSAINVENAQYALPVFNQGFLPEQLGIDQAAYGYK